MQPHVNLPVRSEPTQHKSFESSLYKHKHAHAIYIYIYMHCKMMVRRRDPSKLFSSRHACASPEFPKTNHQRAKFAARICDQRCTHNWKLNHDKANVRSCHSGEHTCDMTTVPLVSRLVKHVSALQACGLSPL